MAVKNKTKGWQNIPDDSVKQPLHDIEIFKNIFDVMPFSVGVFSPDGTILYVNKTGIEMFKINPDGFIGKYNEFQDPTINAATPFEKIKQIYKGETVVFPEVKVPLKVLSARDDVSYNMEALYNDITYFPIMEDGRLKYFAKMHIPCRVYQGKKEIEKAKEYIENNWYDKFVLKDVLAASGLSKTHFTRLFKKHTGTTAHEFYIRVKIGKLKEKLIDPNIGVIQAFTECNLEYSGRFAKIFKDREGVTPSEYKQMNSER